MRGSSTFPLPLAVQWHANQSLVPGWYCSSLQASSEDRALKIARTHSCNYLACMHAANYAIWMPLLRVQPTKRHLKESLIIIHAHVFASGMRRRTWPQWRCIITATYSCYGFCCPEQHSWFKKKRWASSYVEWCAWDGRRNSMRIPGVWKGQWCMNHRDHMNCESCEPWEW